MSAPLKVTSSMVKDDVLTSSRADPVALFIVRWKLA